MISAAIAQKVLHGWMQNRFQTRYPLALNLRHQTPEAAALVAGAVRYALDSIGAEAAECRRAADWLASVGGTLPDAGSVPELPVARLRSAQLATHAYAACAGALGERSMVSRRFLSFLAARLSIPDEAARSLNRRFGG